MDVREYLVRIGIHSEVQADWRSLCLIQAQHMLAVPFENLYIYEGRDIRLRLPDIYHKIVEEWRGGYCYELNGLLYWLLRKLGFTVTMVSARVVNADGVLGPEFDHMALYVRLGREYIVDVGFGDSVRSPLPLTGEVVCDVSGCYRIVPTAGKDKVFWFQKQIEEEWRTEYEFTVRSRELSDFAEMNDYQQSSPNSHFTQKLICSIGTENGRVSLSGDKLLTTMDGVKQEQSVQSQEDMAEILHRCFGVESFLPNRKIANHI